LSNSENYDVHREEQEWIDARLFKGNSEKPRVLLVGDSIARGYYKGVADLLGGTAVVSLVSGSKSVGDPALLSQLSPIIAELTWAVVHFNNGLHGWDYSEDEYMDSFPGFIEMVRKSAPNAALIWASSTPVRSKADLAEFDLKNMRVIARNAIAAEIARTAHIPNNDLYSMMEQRVDCFNPDGVHYNDLGTWAQAEQVAGSILSMLHRAV
jgi:hypothetical protein